MTIDKWTFEDKPPASGWYAISYCWDAQEGIFPGGDFWNGSKWEEGLPVIAYAGPFADKVEAGKWADVHDMEET